MVGFTFSEAEAASRRLGGEGVGEGGGAGLGGLAEGGGSARVVVAGASGGGRWYFVAVPSVGQLQE